VTGIAIFAQCLGFVSNGLCGRRDPRGDTMREPIGGLCGPKESRSYTDIELKTTGKHGNKQAHNSPAFPKPIPWHLKIYFLSGSTFHQQ
jgi:hypothetical protein